MTWLHYTMLSIIFFTLLNVFQRVLATKSRDSRASAIWFNIFGAIVAIIFFLMRSSSITFSFPQSVYAYIGLFASLIFYGLYERGRFKAAKQLPASILVTISNVSVVVSFIGSLILYKETLMIQKIIGATLVISALFLVTQSAKKQKYSIKDISFALLIYVYLGFGWMLDKLGVLYFGLETFMLLVWIFPILVLVYPKIKWTVLKHELVLVNWRMFVLASLNVIGYYFMLQAFTEAEATRVIPLVQTSTIFTVLLSSIFLHERQELGKKILAAGLAVMGTFFLS
jgi:uncharacterized membrane protein